MVRFLILGALLSFARTASAEGWYERERCDQAERLVMAAEFEKADQAIKAIEASHDNDDQACGVWLRVSLTEFQIAHLGRTEPMLAAEDRYLGRMFGFSKAHQRYGTRFKDLELEARMRRIRTFFAAGKRNDAVKEAQRVRAMMEERKKEPPTPTSEYVTASVNSVVASSPWPIRTILKVAGMDGDGAVGRATFKSLYEGKSIYRFESLYVSRHFAETDPENNLEKPSVFSGKLHAAFPTNAALTFDYAKDLRNEGDLDKSLSVITPLLTELTADPEKRTAPIRAKVYWVAAACQLGMGKKPEAKRLADLAAAQKFGDLSAEIEKIEDGI